MEKTWVVVVACVTQTCSLDFLIPTRHRRLRLTLPKPPLRKFGPFQDIPDV